MDDPIHLGEMVLEHPLGALAQPATGAEKLDLHVPSLCLHKPLT